MRKRWLSLPVVLLVATAVGLHARDSKAEGWVVLFNGKDTTGWKLRAPKVTVLKFVDADGKPIKGAKKARVDQKEEARDAKNKPIAGAKVVTRNGEKVIDAEVDRPTGGALDNKVLQPGPILLQGDHGRVAFRNIKIRPLSGK
jgi:hypothetical protein